MKQGVMIGGVAACVMLTGVVAGAEERREMDAHEHGHGTLRIAVDGAALAMEFESPGADIVGFEHAAETDEDRAAIEKALALLGDPAQIVGLPDAARCRVVEATAETVREHDDHGHEDEGHHDEDKHHDEHEDHADDDHDDEEHAHEAGHDDKHDDDEHEHHGDEAGHGEEHSEFVTAYVFECADINALDRITLAYFDLFPNAEELEVQILTAAGAAAQEVDADNPVVELPAAR